MNLKYNAMKVDEIEQSKKDSIENCIQDSSIANLTLFVQKGYVNENGQIGVSKAVALEKIDEYLVDHDKDELVFDIMEALMNGGFLSRGLEIQKLKETRQNRISLANQKIEESLTLETPGEN